MAAKSKTDTTSDTPSRIISRNDLTPAQRADIESMLEDGLLPSQIIERIDVPISIVQNMKRDLKRNPPAAAAVLPTTPSPMQSAAPAAAADPLTAQLNATLAAQLQRELLESQIEDLKAQRRHRQQMNELELEEREQRIRERRMQARMEYGDAVDDEEQPAAGIDPQEMLNNPQAAMWTFFTELIRKQQRGDRAPTQAAAPSADPNAPAPSNAPWKRAPSTDDTVTPSLPAPHTPPAATITEDQIRADLAKVPAHIIALARESSDEQIAEQIIKRRPELNDTDVRNFIAVIRSG